MYMPFCSPYSFYLDWCWVNAGKCCCSNTTNAGLVWRKGHSPFWSFWECKWFFVHWRCCHSQTICSHWHLGLAGIYLSSLYDFSLFQSLYLQIYIVLENSFCDRTSMEHRTLTMLLNWMLQATMYQKVKEICWDLLDIVRRNSTLSLGSLI